MPSPTRVSPEELGAHLAALGVLTPAQWAEALARAGGNIPVALDLLTRARAHWSPPDDPSFALTDYQRAEVVHWLAAPTPGQLQRQLLWNDYLLLTPAGEGGMGVVFKAWDRTNRRYVAIKKTLTDSAEMRRRLLREAELLRGLSHPNIARFYSRETDGNQDLLVMEFLPGNTLAEVTRSRGKAKPVPWPFVAELAVALLDALDHAHGNNPTRQTVVHRDIKPANVMLRKVDRKYVPKLLDLGLAKRLTEDNTGRGDALTRQFQLLGTPEYMAPEQWDGGDRAVPASDVYGLGGTLYYALTDSPPFGFLPEGGSRMAALAEMNERHLKAPRPSAVDVRPDVPAEFDRLLQQMLAVDPAARGTPAALREAFRDLPRIAHTPRRPPGEPESLALAEEEPEPVGLTARRSPEVAEWVRSFARPQSNPVGVACLVLVVLIVGLAAGWAWAAGLVALVGLAVGMAFAKR